MAVKKIVQPLFVEQVAAMFEVTTSTIREWQDQSNEMPLPVFKQGVGRGLAMEYNPRAVFLWGLRKFGTPSELDTDRERALNLRADTRLKEIRAKQLDGESAPLTTLEFALSNLGAQVNAILETIPGKLKRNFPHLGAAEIELIRKEIIKAQNAASSVTLDIDAVAETESAPVHPPRSADTGET